MTIKIDRARESALTMAVADELGRATVTWKQFVKLRPNTELKNEVELLTEEASEKLYRYCGEPGLAGFVSNEIQQFLDQNMISIPRPMR